MLQHFIAYIRAFLLGMGISGRGGEMHAREAWSKEGGVRARAESEDVCDSVFVCVCVCLSLTETLGRAHRGP